MNIPWSTRKKLLEKDLLCDSLKGRVSYFATRYRTAHDRTGRVCVLVDKQEILNIPYETQHKIYRLEREAERRGEVRGLRLYNKIKGELAQEGQFVVWDFGHAVDEYLQNSIEKSISSENMLVRMLAILDRRVGKRTLVHLKEEVNALPNWLQFFYKLRFEAEEA